MGYKIEHNYTLVKQPINICKSNKGVAKEIELISNNNTVFQHNTSVSKLLTTVTENHKESKKTIHHKLKEYTMQHNCI